MKIKTKKIIKIPDFSNYIDKKFIFLEDFKTRFNHILCKGIKFKIKKIKNNDITIKIISDIKESETSIKYFNDFLIKDLKKEIKIFDKIISIWKKDFDKFKPDENNFWNINSNNKGSCINTGYYNIPKDHPKKDGYPDDSFLTLYYKHSQGIKNIYSYQSKKNEWFSLECYEFMKLGREEELKERENFDTKVKKDLFNFIKKNYETTIKELNKYKFKEIKT